MHPNLQADVGNVSLIYISRKNLVHLYESHDPVFRATENIPLPGFSEGGYVPAWQDRVTVIGCVEKIQLCASFHRTTECSPWVGVVRGDNNVTGLETFLKKMLTRRSGPDCSLATHSSSSTNDWGCSEGLRLRTDCESITTLGPSPSHRDSNSKRRRAVEEGSGPM